MADHRSVGGKKYFRLAEKIDDKTKEVKNLQNIESLNEFNRQRLAKAET